MESDTQSEGSLHSPAERAQGRGQGYTRGRAIRPASGTPSDRVKDVTLRQASGAPEPVRSAPRVPVPTRTAPEAPKGQVIRKVTEPLRTAPGVPVGSQGLRQPVVPDSTRGNSGKVKVKQDIHAGVPDLIRATPDSNKDRQPGQKLSPVPGPTQGHGQGKGQSKVKLRPAPVRPEVARQERMSDKPVPPPKVHLLDLPPHAEVAISLTAGLLERDGLSKSQAEKKKGPVRPVPPKGGAKSQENKDINQMPIETEQKNVRSPQNNAESSPKERKPTRPAPDAPVKSGAQGKISGASSGTKSVEGSTSEGKAKPSPTTRTPKLHPNRQQLQQQQYCCIEGSQGVSGQCLCASGEGHQGPYTGSSDDELATDIVGQSEKRKPVHQKKPPPTMKKPTRTYEDPPEKGAPPCYDEITH